jgi:hypothetical protein
MAVLSTFSQSCYDAQAAHHILCKLQAWVKLAVTCQIIDLPGRGQCCQVTVIPTVSAKGHKAASSKVDKRVCWCPVSSPGESQVD